jgi:hypothetical protein
LRRRASPELHDDNWRLLDAFGATVALEAALDGLRQLHVREHLRLVKISVRLRGVFVKNAEHLVL